MGPKSFGHKFLLYNNFLYINIYKYIYNIAPFYIYALQHVKKVQSKNICAGRFFAFPAVQPKSFPFQSLTR
jgi:hypothetical protein